MKIVTSEQMRLLETRAVDSGVPEDHLMENAGLAVARRIGQLLDGVRGKRAVVLVGPGNNGGDGMVAARYLADWGALVTLYMMTPRRRGDKFEDCRARRVRIVEAIDDLDHWQLLNYASLADVVLDAVLGIGTRPGLESNIRGVFEAISHMASRSHGPVFVALDVPTGLDADSGDCDEACFHASLTLTLGAPKHGLFLFPGARYVGALEALPIGLPKGIDDDITTDLIDMSMAAALMPTRHIEGHKGSFGSLLVIGGSRRFVGAPVLASNSAYRTGAGLVTLATPESTYRIVAAHLLEQTHLPLEETPAGGVAPSAAAAARIAMRNAAAAVVGPGLGNAESTAAFIQGLLLTKPLSDVPVVIDADALNALSITYGWEQHLVVDAVLTPHPGEMGRLLAINVQAVQEDRIAAAVTGSQRWGQVVVLKGAHTIVAAPDGRVAVSPFANPALGSAGTGDVLAGIIGALLAQGLACFAAAVVGVYLHGLAGERWRTDNGDAGLLASDLLPLLPRVAQEVRRT